MRFYVFVSPVEELLLTCFVLLLTNLTLQILCAPSELHPKGSSGKSRCETCKDSCGTDIAGLVNT
jgi:hypothetical protein